VKRAMLLGAVAVATLAAAFIMWELRLVVFLFMLALAIAAAARPLIDALVARRVPRVVALLVVYVTTVTVAVVTSYFLGIELGGELQRASDRAFVGYEKLRHQLIIDGGLRARVGGLLPSMDTLAAGLSASHTANDAASATMGFAHLVGQMVLVLVLALYWDAYRQESLRFWLGLLRPERRRRVRDLWVRTLANVGEQLRAEIGQSLVMLGVCALAFRGMNLSYWVLPAIVVAMARLFPFVGVLFGVTAAALAGAVDGPMWAALAAGVVIGVHLLLRHVIAGRLLRRKQSNPVVLIFCAMVLVTALGLPGLVLAPLVTAALQPVMESALALRASPHPGPVRDLTDVQLRLELLKAKVAEAGTPPSPEVQSLVTRLESLVEAAHAAVVPTEA
jgi:predicted PurR-regulated permease PerM